MLSSPTVNGALCSVLGHDYALHAHRALHRADRSEEQGFHKDGQEGHGPHRHHRPRWAMVMYYPAGCTLQEHKQSPPRAVVFRDVSERIACVFREMAPTALLPGGQYFAVDDGKWGEVAQTYGHSIGLSEFKLTGQSTLQFSVVSRRFLLPSSFNTGVNDVKSSRTHAIRR